MSSQAAKALPAFAREGTSVSMRTRAATVELLRRARPGWEVRSEAVAPGV